MKKMQLEFVNRLFKHALVGAMLASSGWSMTASATAVKADPMAARGCISKIDTEQALAVMRKFHFHSFHARPAETRTLGTALYYIEKLNGGRPLHRATADPDSNYGYSFHDAVRNSHEAGSEIRVNRNGRKNYGENVAQLVHELGHYIGNNGGYQSYYDAVGGQYCKVSNYSRTNFHEQFAEVFAAFVTRPALLKRNPSRACQRAYHYFANVIFPGSDALTNKCIAHQDALLGHRTEKPKDDEKPASRSEEKSHSNKPTKKVEFKLAKKKEAAKTEPKAKPALKSKVASKKSDEKKAPAKKSEKKSEKKAPEKKASPKKEEPKAVDTKKVKDKKPEVKGPEPKAGAKPKAERKKDEKPESKAAEKPSTDDKADPLAPLKDPLAPKEKLKGDGD